MGVTSDYIAKYKKDMIDACSGTGLFPSVMMAQGILESRNGLSKLAADYNNHFGIKQGTGWSGSTITMDTTEVVGGKSIVVKAPFRSYPTTFDGFVDRVNFLKRNPRYSKAGVFTAKNPEEQAKALKAAGYATDPDYPNKLIKIINDFGLRALDNAPANRLRVTTTTKKTLIGIGMVFLSLSAFLVVKKTNGMTTKTGLIIIGVLAIGAFSYWYFTDRRKTLEVIKQGGFTINVKEDA